MRLSRNLPAWIYTLSLHDALPISPPFLFSCPSFLSLECSITSSGCPPFSPPPCTVPKSLKVKEEGCFFLHLASICFWRLHSSFFLSSQTEWPKLVSWPIWYPGKQLTSTQVKRGQRSCRRSLATGICILSRYLLTVLRATLKPFSLNLSVRTWSLKGFSLSSLSMIF